MVAATPTSTTENRSMRPLRRVCLAACDRAVGTAIVITPLAAGAVIGRTTDARRKPSFIPTVRSAPEWALRLHRVMRRRALAGYTADQGVTPLPRRPFSAYPIVRTPHPDPPPQGGEGESRIRQCLKWRSPVKTMATP